MNHEQKRLLVTSPPASGKTSIRKLITQQLEAERKSVFLLQSSPPKGEAAQRKFLRSELKHGLCGVGVPSSEFKSKTYSELLTLVLTNYDYIFIDDAQRWFSTGLVEDLTKGMGSTPARVGFFASLSLEASEQATPAIAGRLSWNDFRLEESEQLDFCNRIIKWATTG